MTNAVSVVVAVDGPSASGKSTVSRQVAQALDFVYVDSGALYRAVTWKAVHEGVDVNDTPRVLNQMETTVWDFNLHEHALAYTLDGEDPGQQIRSEPVRERVSVVAAIPEVRHFVVEQLRKCTRFGSLVMEGRDIGTVVFPDTPFKFYLDADPTERARRRHREIVDLEGDGQVEDVLASLQRRDHLDSHRETAPLQIPLGATVINSTQMPVDEVVAFIVAQVRQKTD